MDNSYFDSSQFDQNPDDLLKLYDLSEADLEQIRGLGKKLENKLAEMMDRWYSWLKLQPEYKEFFSDPQTLERAQKLQSNYWDIFLKCQVDDEYIKQRQRVGTTHARIGLPFNTYFAGMNMFITVFRDLLEEKEGASKQQNNTMVAMTKLMHLDTSIVVESYMQMVNETIAAQTKSLMEMSTPVTQIWDGILLLPIVGIIDSKRAQDILNATLEQIAKYHARIYILDIGGVAVVDTAVANHLIKITKATALMGCESIISGISPAIAQTIVELGIDVGTVKTTATMQDALSSAFQQTGMDIVEVQHDG